MALVATGWILSLKKTNPTYMDVATPLSLGILSTGILESPVMPYRLVLVPGFFIFLLMLSTFHDESNNKIRDENRILKSLQRTDLKSFI